MIELDIDRDRITKELLVESDQIRRSIEAFIAKSTELGVATQINAGNSGLFKGVTIQMYDKNTLNEIQ
jgi:predicted alpha-1,6-mannanase (GH76 family)